MKVTYYIEYNQKLTPLDPMPTNDIDAWTEFKKQGASLEGKRNLIKEIKTHLYTDG